MRAWVRVQERENSEGVVVLKTCENNDHAIGWRGKVFLGLLNKSVSTRKEGTRLSEKDQPDLDGSRRTKPLEKSKQTVS